MNTNVKSFTSDKVEENIILIKIIKVLAKQASDEKAKIPELKDLRVKTKAEIKVITKKAKIWAISKKY